MKDYLHCVYLDREHILRRQADGWHYWMVKADKGWRKHLYPETTIAERRGRFLSEEELFIFAL